MADVNAGERLKSEFLSALTAGTLKKAVLSRKRDKAELKTVLTVFERNGEATVKAERFMPDGKALQSILSISDAAALMLNAPDTYRQINLIAEGASLELIVSDKGKTRFTGSLEGARKAELSVSQDKKKSYIITPETDGDLLFALGITDKNGRIHDKKQAKYRQINKFIEQIEAVASALPTEGRLTVCDLCCGKSYLTFAVYRYFTHHKGRQVEMYGVDLKNDVIEYCSEVAKKLGYNGMTFECGDVSKFAPKSSPDLVISLHACDIATDFALAGAVKSGAKVILSTPCCQHELNGSMKSEPLDFVLRHSILKQKVASAMTDALRAQLLEIYGYSVTVCELIDPEETPKNVIIRAVKNGKRRTAGAMIEEYRTACELIGVTPMLAKLLPLPESERSIPLARKNGE